jgi:RNA polymerase sigma factor (sigma-70 family)
VKRYQRLIYSIPRRAGLDEDAAAEVFQDVFTTLLENADSIEQPSRLQAWLVTTAKRKTWRAVSRARSSRPFEESEEQGEGEMYRLADEALLPDEVLERLEQQHLVRAALGELEERCRRLLSLLFYSPEPPPYSEIAAALGASEGSIGPTRARCLKKLLDVLREKGYS